MTCNETFDKYFSLLETIQYNYQYSVLSEASDGDNESAVKKTVAATAAIKKVIYKIWHTLSVLIKSVINKITSKFAKADKGHLGGTENILVYDDLLKPSGELFRYIRKLAVGNCDENTSGEIKKFIDASKKNGKLFKPGEEINMALISKNLGLIDKEVEKAQTMNAKYTFDPEKQDICTKALSEIQVYITDLTNVVNKLNTYVETPTTAVKRAMSTKLEEKNEVKNESIDLSSVDAIKSLRASILIEAAELLREGAEDNTSGIEGGEGTQKAIDDIPEEKETEDDEYDPEVNGADSDNSDPDMEDIKDLVDGDQEAIKILTDDEGSKTVTEAITFDFNF